MDYDIVAAEIGGLGCGVGVGGFAFGGIYIQLGKKITEEFNLTKLIGLKLLHPLY